MTTLKNKHKQDWYQFKLGNLWSELLFLQVFKCDLSLEPYYLKAKLDMLLKYTSILNRATAHEL